MEKPVPKPNDEKSLEEILKIMFSEIRERAEVLPYEEQLPIFCEMYTEDHRYSDRYQEWCDACFGLTDGHRCPMLSICATGDYTNPDHIRMACNMISVVADEL